MAGLNRLSGLSIAQAELKRYSFGMLLKDQARLPHFLFQLSLIKELDRLHT